MNIIILTLNSRSNYGGLLQNFALQKLLQKENHNVKTINCLVTPTWWRLFFSWIKTIFLRFCGIKRDFICLSKMRKRAAFAEEFVNRFVVLTKPYLKLKPYILKENVCDCVVVGSDQVWRPKYNFRIDDMYLAFAKKFPVKRIAYAASFGVEKWEYTPMQTRLCRNLAGKFDAISVREESGIKLCKENLGVDASWVLDPTLLLQKEDYDEICKDVPVSTEKFLVAYILDKNESILSMCKLIAKNENLKLILFEAGPSATLSVPEWLARFRDASYVVTDSFHGTVFSIIFGKKFKYLYNKSRGSARLESLLKLYNSGRIEEMRDFSIKWLKQALVT